MEIISIEEKYRKSQKQMIKLREKKLRKLLSYAFSHSAYYQQSFEAAGITKRQIRTMLQILKLLRKGPRSVYIAATDGRYGGAMSVGDGIRRVRAEQLFLDVKTPLSEWTKQIRDFRLKLRFLEISWKVEWLM